MTIVRLHQARDRFVREWLADVAGQSSRRSIGGSGRLRLPPTRSPSPARHIRRRRSRAIRAALETPRSQVSAPHRQLDGEREASRAAIGPRRTLAARHAPRGRASFLCGASELLLALYASLRCVYVTVGKREPTH